jgi:hypothetical protein
MSNVHPDPSRVNTGSAEHDSDPSTWPSWVDLWIWEPNGPAGGDDLGMVDVTDADEDQGDELDEDDPCFDLASWVEHQAARYRSLGTEAGAMLADTLHGLASLIRLTGAHTPAVAQDRLAALDDALLGVRWSDHCN